LRDMFELKDAFDGSSRSVDRVFVSAKTGEGLPHLRELLSSYATSLPAE
jgi:GTP-binding protein HflX